ncbi:MAG: hypothetical protein Q7R49_01990 [Candidatus Daviesbacteria bacterium]|nr:hypothetical protein [Candidatus Daviesbacteria bacterium]
MKRVLFIAGLNEEYYYRPFIEACKGKDITVYVFDSSLFPEKATLGIRLEGSHVSGFIDVIKYGTNDSNKSLENIRLSISEIDIAWHLRENLAKEEKPEATLEKRFTDNESIIAVRSFFSVLPCAWINKKETVNFLSSNKLYQQMVAHQSGLLTPKTLISNDPTSVLKFSDSDKGLLLKSLGYIKLDDEGKYYLYSQRFTQEELEGSTKAIRRCPVFVQEYIDKCCEHRVMVIGDAILSCKIDSQASEKTKVDWRHYDFEHVAHTASQLPTAVQGALKRFMQKIDLRYGAIDLIETPTHEFVFLEVNPSGQWGWIADLAGLPIPKAVAEMLESL